MDLIVGIIATLLFMMIFYRGYAKDVNLFYKFDLIFLFLFLFVLFARIVGINHEYYGFWPNWSWKMLESTGDKLAITSSLPWVILRVWDGIYYFQPLFMIASVAFILSYAFLKKRIQLNLDLLDRFLASVFITATTVLCIQYLLSLNSIEGVLNIFGLGETISQILIHLFIVLFYLVLNALFKVRKFGLAAIFTWGIVGLVLNIVDNSLDLDFINSNFNYIEVGAVTIIGVVLVMYSAIKLNLTSNPNQRNPGEISRIQNERREKITSA